MNTFYLEGASVSSSSRLHQLKHTLEKQEYSLTLGIPSMFNSSIRIKNLLHLSLMPQSLNHPIDEQLDELRNEHVLFIYNLLKPGNQTSALIYVQQFFNILEDRFKAVQVLNELSEKTIESCKLLLEQISTQIVSQFLHENGISVMSNTHSNYMEIKPLTEIKLDLNQPISLFPLDRRKLNEKNITL